MSNIVLNLETKEKYKLLAIQNLDLFYILNNYPQPNGLHKVKETLDAKTFKEKYILIEEHRDNIIKDILNG
jgi:hypothetical protein